MLNMLNILGTVRSSERMRNFPLGTDKFSVVIFIFLWRGHISLLNLEHEHTSDILIRYFMVHEFRHIWWCGFFILLPGDILMHFSVFAVVKTIRKVKPINIGNIPIPNLVTFIKNWVYRLEPCFWRYIFNNSSGSVYWYFVKFNFAFSFQM